MLERSNRRQFLQTTAAVGIGYWVAAGTQAAPSKSPNERIAFASIGVSGKGSSDLAGAAKQGDIVALCDVDDKRLGAAAKLHPGAKTFNDFRKMLDEMGKSIDAVTVSTPDHMHAPASLLAMRLGKHCFCQKPLTRTIYESRLMAQVAREKKVATQMGNQGTAASSLRREAALLRAGALGTVEEVHIWTNRPIWPQGITRPEPSPCPTEVHWDLWLGVAPPRPYAEDPPGNAKSKEERETSAAIILSNGAAGGISAVARWATWAATFSTCPTWDWTCGIPFPSRPKLPARIRIVFRRGRS